MDWSIVFFTTSLLLGVGLAMDAFSVSLANGLNEPRMNGKRMCKIASVFAAFQAFMPLMGWLCVHTVLRYFQAFEKLIPWIALVLLLWIGGKMLADAIKNKGEDVPRTPMGKFELFVQGVATSIDALSVGFTIAEYGLLMAVVCALIIAVVTFVICMVGLKLGKKFGMKFSNAASIFGGIILIAIGVEIFVTGI